MLLNNENLRHNRLAILLILLVAFTLRVFRLGYQSLWVDELWSLDFATRSLPEITIALASDIHPPLYFYLLHFWVQVAGQTELAIRFLSLIFSLATVVAVFEMGRRVFNPTLGLIAATFAAFSPLQIHDAQETRMYALLALGSLLSAYFLWRAWFERRGLFWLGYALSTVVALYTHYSAAFLLVAHAILVGVLLTATSRNRPLPGLRWLASVLVIFTLYLPQLGVALRQTSSWKNITFQAPELGYFISQLWQTFTLYATPGPGVPWFWLAGLAGILVSGLSLGSVPQSWQRRDSLPLFFTILWFLMPILQYWIVLQQKPLFHPRYIMLVGPAFLLLLAYAVAEIWKRLRPWGVIAFAFTVAASTIGVNAYYFDPAYSRDDTRGMMSCLEQATTERDVILTPALLPYLKYYYRGRAPIYPLGGDPITVPDELTTLAQGKERFFIVEWMMMENDPQALVHFLLGRYGRYLTEYRFHGYRVLSYRLPPSPQFSLATKMEPFTINFGDQLALKGYALGGGGLADSVDRQASPNVRLPADGAVWAVLEWTSAKKTSVDYAASLQLTDRQGRLVGQADRLLISMVQDPTKGQLFGSRTSAWSTETVGRSYHVLPIAPGTSPGEYHLSITVYDPKTMGWLRAFSKEGTGLGRHAPLASISLSKALTPPAISDLRIKHLRDISFSEIRLLGYDLPQPSVRPGSKFTVGLYWEALSRVEGDYQMELLLQGKDGGIWAEAKTRPGGGLYPTTEWTAGERLRDWYDLRLKPEAPPGEAQLILRVWDSRSGGLVGEEALSPVTIDEGRRRLFSPPPIQNVMETKLGHTAKFLGYDLERHQVSPGEQISVTLYWLGLSPMETSYTAFVHVLDPGSQTRGEDDNIPGQGLIPTIDWYPGEIVIDKHNLWVDTKAPPGLYFIEVGLYDWTTLERLPVSEASGKPAGDRILLGPIKVQPQSPASYRIPHRLSQTLGNQVELVGYGVDRKVVPPGETLHLTLYWKALTKMDHDYTVFTHLIDKDNKIWGQKDNPPVGGYYPTSLWENGETIKDEYEIVVSDGIQPGKYQIEVGMYLPANGKRLLISDVKGRVTGDRILLPIDVRVAGR